MRHPFLKQYNHTTIGGWRSEKCEQRTKFYSEHYEWSHG